MENSMNFPHKTKNRVAISSVQFSHSVMSDCLWPHGLQNSRLPCPSPTPGVYSNSCPSSQWCHPTIISSSVVPFSSCLQSFPASVQFSSVAQSCLTLCNPKNCSTPGSPVLLSLWVFSGSYPLSWWCHPSISSSTAHFSSCLQSFPASGSFPMSRLSASGGQSIGASASASVLPMNILGRCSKPISHGFKQCDDEHSCNQIFERFC